MSAYLAVFEFAALLATDRAWAVMASMCESAKLSGMAAVFSLDHRSSVTPSGLLLSVVVTLR